jgi:hypothetical protein
MREAGVVGAVVLAMLVLAVVVLVHVADAQTQLGEYFEKKEGRCAQDNPHPKPFKVPASRPIFLLFLIVI